MTTQIRIPVVVNPISRGGIYQGLVEIWRRQGLAVDAVGDVAREVGVGEELEHKRRVVDHLAGETLGCEVLVGGKRQRLRDDGV